MTPTPEAACRLFIIMAREARIGLIFRRGPTKWTQIIKWNTQTDTFEYGAWFKGQIYPERSDLSPDGSKLIYLATAYGAHRNSDHFPNEWTAISKTPWLTTLAAWPNLGTYYGGGLFETNTSVWPSIDHRYATPVPDFQPQGLDVSYEHRFWDPDWMLLYRLERDGWEPIEKYPGGSVPVYHLQLDGGYIMKPTDHECPLLTRIQTVHEKASSQGTFSLILTTVRVYSGGGRTRTFTLNNKSRRTLIPLPDVVWADWDQSGRFVYAKEGKLLTAELRGTDELIPRELADFNGLRPKRTKSPPWAREW